MLLQNLPKLCKLYSNTEMTDKDLKFKMRKTQNLSKPKIWSIYTISKFDF